MWCRRAQQLSNSVRHVKAGSVLRKRPPFALSDLLHGHPPLPSIPQFQFLAPVLPITGPMLSFGGGAAPFMASDWHILSLSSGQPLQHLCGLAIEKAASQVISKASYASNAQGANAAAEEALVGLELHLERRMQAHCLDHAEHGPSEHTLPNHAARILVPFSEYGCASSAHRAQLDLAGSTNMVDQTRTGGIVTRAVQPTLPATYRCLKPQETYQGFLSDSDLEEDDALLQACAEAESWAAAQPPLPALLHLSIQPSKRPAHRFNAADGASTPHQQFNTEPSVQQGTAPWPQVTCASFCPQQPSIAPPACCLSQDDAEIHSVLKFTRPVSADDRHESPIRFELCGMEFDDAAKTVSQSDLVGFAPLSQNMLVSNSNFVCADLRQHAAGDSQGMSALGAAWHGLEATTSSDVPKIEPQEGLQVEGFEEVSGRLLAGLLRRHESALCDIVFGDESGDDQPDPLACVPQCRGHRLEGGCEVEVDEAWEQGDAPAQVGAHEAQRRHLSACQGLALMTNASEAPADLAGDGVQDAPCQSASTHREDVEGTPSPGAAVLQVTQPPSIPTSPLSHTSLHSLQQEGQVASNDSGDAEDAVTERGSTSAVARATPRPHDDGSSPTAGKWKRKRALEPHMLQVCPASCNQFVMHHCLGLPSTTFQAAWPCLLEPHPHPLTSSRVSCVLTTLPACLTGPCSCAAALRRA
jgi:hypothetical protein